MPLDAMGTVTHLPLIDVHYWQGWGCLVWLLPCQRALVCSHLCLSVQRKGGSFGLHTAVKKWIKNLEWGNRAGSSHSMLSSIVHPLTFTVYIRHALFPLYVAKRITKSKFILRAVPASILWYVELYNIELGHEECLFDLICFAFAKDC